MPLVTMRYSRKGPSLKRHLVMALLVSLLLPALIGAYGYVSGNPADAAPHGYAVLDVMPQSARPNQLDGDLLIPVDILAPGDNAQTAQLSPVIVAGDGAMAGSDGLAPARATSRPPAVVTINGQPVSAGETAYIGREPAAAPGQYIPATGSDYSAPLIRAPIPGYSQQGPFGAVPSPNAAGQTPFDAYAKPFAARKDSTKVAIIVRGLGLNPAITQRAINELPAEVTLSFAPHATGLQAWIDKARAKGHEVVLEVPMEPYNLAQANPADIPPFLLRADVTPADNARMLDRILSRAQGYFAVTNFYGELFLDSPIKAAPIFGQLRNTGLGFIYSESDQSGRIEALATGMPWTQGRAYIDLGEGAARVQSTLVALEASTNPGGDIPLAVGGALPATLDGIIVWASTLEDTGTIIVPVSYKMKNKP